MNQARELVKQAAAALRSTRRGDCWCEMGVGNPMVQRHSESCLEVAATLAELDGWLALPENDASELAMPAGLSLAGAAAYHSIMRVLTQAGTTHTGGCKAFYSPSAWETHEGLAPGALGSKCVLVVVHDGGCLAPYFNWDYEDIKSVERMRAALDEVGVWSESQTCWWTAIFTK